ncbi:hypothetical protein HMPREF0083_02367 [Aneurinibacillus aneurinilyticus ATCC 12856]|uniref:Uncharacterized protein n=1 Tax=Aneurinibacillus aneurinilyticus ATCC 12856 TaxID=649747 RepID=U1YFE3_ANEAE|nr:hypothetical protein HMPREF0083_02367 [Aneurinibacillus aneurinilyticus ATCC 12856]
MLGKEKEISDVLTIHSYEKDNKGNFVSGYNRRNFMNHYLSSIYNRMYLYARE